MNLKIHYGCIWETVYLWIIIYGIKIKFGTFSHPYVRCCSVFILYCSHSKFLCLLDFLTEDVLFKISLLKFGL